ncbi:MAG: superoxide dismutase family protein [Betaproteobacteria bacterium]|nr:superoxide dismutase family protein [Betaproteobacteria bacterium]
MRYLFSLSILALSACGTPALGPSAVGILQPTNGNSVTGTVTFKQLGDSVLVTGTVSGLTPNQEHGFHVHEKGDCSSGNGLSTGGHFNPEAKGHGAHGLGSHHAGDLPSLKADASGKAEVNFTSKTISVVPGVTQIVGRGLIVHRDPDDFKTQPTGNAGPRLACAVIKP